MDNDLLTYAYRLLSRKDYTELELRKKLKSRFPSETGFFDTIIDKLKAYNYIDDEKYTTRYTLSKCKSGYGPRYIRYKLKEKGIQVDQEQISLIIENEIDLAMIASNLIQQKLKRNRNQNISSLKKKYFDFLTRRGFDTHLILKVLQEELRDESYFS